MLCLTIVRFFVYSFRKMLRIQFSFCFTFSPFVFLLMKFIRFEGWFPSRCPPAMIDTKKKKEEKFKLIANFAQNKRIRQ